MKGMHLTAIIEQLRNERDRINGAIEALSNIGRGSDGLRRGTRHRMSAAARAKIAAAQRARWARQRKIAKV